MMIFFLLNVFVVGFVVNLSCFVLILDNIVNLVIYGYKWVEIDFYLMVIGNSGGSYVVGGVCIINMWFID